ncbi:MAG: hypothetical protein IJG47_14445 [Microbacterium sp.]|nr:hypothetical protein [Microbacterium sp.]
MPVFEADGDEMNAAARRFEEVADSLSALPIHDLVIGDVGSPQVADALRAFQSEWSAYVRRRTDVLLVAKGTLVGVANDVARADELIAQRADRLGRAS